MIDEKLLINDLREGSYKAFNLLYGKYHPRLYSFVFKTVKSNTLSADIVQETFIRIWESRQTINPEQSFKSFIFQIAHNQIINEYRRQINRPEMVDYIEFVNDSKLADISTLQQIDLDDFLLRLAKAKQHLSPRQKEIFELVREQGHSIKEVAERLGIVEQVVYNQLSLAVKTLKQHLGDAMLLFYIFFGC